MKSDNVSHAPFNSKFVLNTCLIESPNLKVNPTLSPSSLIELSFLIKSIALSNLSLSDLLIPLYFISKSLILSI